MLPSDLKAADFAAYPALARDIAARNLTVLRRLPISFAPLLLRELIVYDSKFPAEREDLDRQFAYISPLPPERVRKTVALFAGLSVAPELEAMDWVNEPALFAEKLTAHLWATHQIEAFREAAVDFVSQVNAALPEKPATLQRMAIVAIGQGVKAAEAPLFRKLRPHGTLFTKVQPGKGFPLVVDAVRRRALSKPIPYGHWYIDGGESAGRFSGELVSLSYESIRPLRAALQSRLQKAWEAGMGSEALRTALAKLRPEEFGLHGDAVLDRFQVSLLTEGSGTQVYSTTFVQWAAREALRRAQPATLLVRFAPRQRERAMSEMLDEARKTPALDPESSLRDADMGAYYTWLNLQRLAGSQDSGFLAWCENNTEAVLIASGVARGIVSDAAIGLEELIERLIAAPA